ncbi:MAG: MFS transporter [Lachnospiraceae bacterium]|nr:MFS transporter [Lachnospiraceae bacterium]
MGKGKTKETGVPFGAREKMPLWFGLAWSTRGISAAINAILMMQITFYCTDILGLKAGIIGSLFLGSKIIDAFTDLGFGFILDKTHTKLGKARPYELFIVFEWLFTVFMFNAPQIGEMGQYIWIFIMYVMVNAVCATALGGIDSVYLARTFTTNQNQIKAMSINGFVVMFVSIAFNIWFPSWLADAGRTQAGWAALMIPLGVVMAVIGLLRFILCKEVVVDEEIGENGKKQTNDLTVKESMQHLMKNKYLFIVVGLMFLTFWVNNMQTATTYYFKYIVGDISLQGTVAITSMIVIPALVVFPLLSKKFGTTNILRACSLIGAIGLVIRTLGGTSLATLILGGCLMGIGTLPISMMINTYLIDCMDYGEWKTGVRIEGMVASIANFASKVGNGVALGSVGFIMGLAGYDGRAAVQSASANNAIIFLFNIFPLILFVIMFILSLNYKVDKIRPQMEADLKATREGASA